MKILKIPTLSPREITLIRRISLLSVSASFLIAIVILATSQLKDKKSSPLHQSHAASTQPPSPEEHQHTPTAPKTSLQKNTTEVIDIEAHQSAAWMYLNQASLNRAIEHTERITSLEPFNAAASVSLATLYLQAGEYEKALQLFRDQSLRKLPDSIAMQMLPHFGLTLFFMRDIQQSVKVLDEAIGHFPHSALAYCFRAQVEAAINLTSPKVMDYFQKALQCDSLHDETLYQLSRYMMNKPSATRDDYLKSRLLLLKVIEQQPLHAKAHARLAMVYYMLDQPQLSEKSYITALTLNDNDYNTHYNLGQLYFYLESDTKKALQEFKRTIQLKETHSAAHFKIGLISLGNQMFKEAADHFQKALENDPQNTRIMLQLAVAFEQLQMKSAAMEQYRKILQQDNFNTVAQQKLRLLDGGQFQ
ncbi:MAG: tetratricopeptide repeat protein [Chitinivibrionales bacterium]|nr:tetratricopeptide repeat protein [Chitinivibrionales bacterium]